MALWQFTFRILPKQVLLEANRPLPVKLSHDEFLDLPTWNIRDYEVELFRMLGEFLPKFEKEWSENRASWGKDDETYFYFFYDSEKMVEFTVRFDLRSLTKEMLELVEKIGKLLDAVLVTELGSVIEPTSQGLLGEIKKSKAFRFIKDPRGFFDNNES